MKARGFISYEPDEYLVMVSALQKERLSVCYRGLAPERLVMQPVVTARDWQSQR